MESFLDQYDGTQIYYVPQLGYYTMEHNYILDENGHSEYIISLADSKIIKQPIDILDENRFFPHLLDLYTYAQSRKESVIDRIQNGDYEVITMINGQNNLYGFDISTYYKCIKSYSIRTGMQINTIDMWIPADNIITN